MARAMSRFPAKTWRLKIVHPPLFPVYSTGQRTQSRQAPSEKLTFRGRVNRSITIMGDKSPKSVTKKATQKQSKADTANQAKKQAEAAKSVVGKKR